LFTARSAEEGLKIAKKHLPDIIISDIILPDTSGLELCQTIKEEPYLKNSIIILSSSSETESVNTDQITQGQPYCFK